MLQSTGSQRVGHDWATERRCVEWVTAENLWFSSGPSTQCSVMTSVGRKSEKRGYMYASS